MIGFAGAGPVSRTWPEMVPPPGVWASTLAERVSVQPPLQHTRRRMMCLFIRVPELCHLAVDPSAGTAKRTLRNPDEFVRRPSLDVALVRGPVARIIPIRARGRPFDEEVHHAWSGESYCSRRRAPGRRHRDRVVPSGSVGCVGPRAA